jgi:hypothetical protein
MDYQAADRVFREEGLGPFTKKLREAPHTLSRGEGALLADVLENKRRRPRHRPKASRNLMVELMVRMHVEGLRGKGTSAKAAVSLAAKDWKLSERTVRRILARKSLL